MRPAAQRGGADGACHRAAMFFRAWRIPLPGRLLPLLALLWAIFAAAAVAAEPDFTPVRPGHAPAFPQDGGAHPGFRTEWWYVTGWVSDEAGVERGFQLTFFRVRTGIGEGSRSRFAPSQLMLAHAAIADPALGRLRQAERAERAFAPLAGAEEGRTRAWIRDWSLEQQGERYRSRVQAQDFEFELDFVAERAPLLNGEAGFSRKAADPRHASHYYSRPQLQVSGRLVLDGRPLQVHGRAWLDHEWSSELMPAQARGWDWIGINLHDGGALMAFRLRDGEGRSLWTALSLRAGDPRRADRTWQGPEVLRFVPLRTWRSPRTGIEYPVQWRLSLSAPGEPPRQLRLVPLFDDQELDSRRSTGALYWEGAVRLIEEGIGQASGEEFGEETGEAERGASVQGRGASGRSEFHRPGADAPHMAGQGAAIFHDAREIGRGYLEMTGYARRLELQ